GEAFHAIAAEALALAGCDVVDVGVAMTPTVGVVVVHHRADAGLTLTASHNPGEWNGLKPVTRDGAAPNAIQTGKIIKAVHDGAGRAGARAAAGGVANASKGAKIHVGRVPGAMGAATPMEAIKARRFGVILDSVNASGVVGGRMLLEALGCRLTHLNNSPT